MQADGSPVRVTVDNFGRAESDAYFARFVGEGGFGKLKHERALAPIDHQTVIRLNRDTFYSFGVFDLDAGPVTITLPDAGKRYMAVQVIDEDHFAPEVFYAPGTHTLTKEQVGTRYVCLADADVREPQRRGGRRGGARPAGRDQDRAGRGGRVRGSRLGRGVAQAGPRGARWAWRPPTAGSTRGGCSGARARSIRCST